MALGVSVALLFIGVAAGFLGQKSRMCFIGGFRDFLLVRDTALLRGLLSFLATTWILVFILGRAGVIVPRYPSTIVQVVRSHAGDPQGPLPDDIC